MVQNSTEKKITALLERARIPGCSIVVVNGARVLWTGGFGYADLRSHRQAASNTVYHLFSGTKIYTAVAVLQLVERGVLALDQDITVHLPQYAQLEGITIRHLLSHSSGLKDTLRGFLAVYFPDDPTPSTADALALYKLVRAGEPGVQAVYRNVNYALLGEIISRVSGMPYLDWMRKEVLAPLQMGVAFRVTDEMRPHAATGYVDRWDPARLMLWVLLPGVSRRLYRGRVAGFAELNDYNLSSAAIGGLVGPVPEFAKFVQSQLKDGAPLLSAAMTQQMQTLSVKGSAGIESKEGMGLGWKIGRVGATQFLNHEGGGAGFSSETRLYPDSDLGIVLAMNVMRMPKTMRVAHEICETIRQEQQSAP